MPRRGSIPIVSTAGATSADKPSSKKGPAPLAVLAVAVLAVSFAAVFVRLADAPGTVVALYRMAIAGLVLAPFTYRALRKSPLTGRNLKLTAAAALLLAIHFASWITSLSMTSVAASVTLVATAPLWAALFSWLFAKEPQRAGVVIGAVVAVVGATVLALGSDGGEQRTLGNLLALVGAIAAAGYLNLGRAVQRSGVALDAYVGTAYALAALVLLPLPALFSQAYFGYPTSSYAWMLLLALVPQLIGHTGLNYASRHLDTALVATATLAEPIGSGILAILIFGEMPGYSTLVGGAVVLTGLVVAVRSGVASPSSRPRNTTARD